MRIALRSTLLGLVGLAALVAAGCGAGDSDASARPDSDAERPARSAKVVVRYAEPTSDLTRYLREEGFVQDVADSVMREVRLPHEITIAMGDGDGSPQYHYGTRTITFPWTFADAIEQTLRERGYAGDRLRAGVLDVAAFVLTHEVAHALIDVLDLPITGKEEDAADDFAALAALGYERNEQIVRASADFLRGTDAGGGRAVTEFADEHSLDIQRFFTLTCVMYGSDPASFGDVAAAIGMNPQRLDACPGQWQRTVRAWYRLLEPHLTQSGS